ncbi:maleylpyruvate isomerase family mycothiol-dependent enzyme [Streptomyces sp. NPDC002851]
MSDPAGIEDCCSTILDQTGLLCSVVRDADLTLPVPTLPGWNLGNLLRHIGGTQQWAELAVRTRATAPVPHDDLVNDVTGHDDKDPGVLTEWLTGTAGRLVAALREAPADAPVWAPAPPRTPLFWARRLAVEAMVHRYDAARAAGAPYRLEPAAALIGLDEWMAMSVLPQAAEPEARRELLAPGRTLHLHATDAAPAETGEAVESVESGEWLLDLSGPDIALRRAHEKATVAVRGPAAELLLLVYDRRDLDGDGDGGGDGDGDGGSDVAVFGDAALFTQWRETVSFWTRKK